MDASDYVLYGFGAVDGISGYPPRFWRAKAGFNRLSYLDQWVRYREGCSFHGCAIVEAFYFVPF